MLVGINTKGIGPMDMGNTRTSKMKDQIDQKAAEAFSSLMNLNQGIGDSDSTFANKTVSVKETSYDFGMSSSKAKVRDDMDADTYVVEDSVKDKTVENKSNDYSKKTDNKQDNQVSSEDKNQEEEVVSKDKIQKVVSEIRKNVKECLGLTDEEFDNLLQEFGIELSDLLNPDTLKDFVLEVQDATEIDMLINEDLNQLVNSLLESVEQIKESFDVSETELVDFDGPLLEEEKIVVSAEEDSAVKKEKNITSEDNVLKKDVQEAETKTTIQIEGKQEIPNNREFSQDMQNSNDTVFDNLNQAVNQALQTETVSAGEFDGAVAEADVVRQVVDQIRVNMTKEITSLTIKLNPEQLGNVQITVASKDGTMQARIIAENEAAKNAIENSLTLLKETFENQDLKVEEIEVMVGTGDFFAETEQEMNEENQNEKSENKVGGINLNAISDDEINEDNELEVEMMKAQGNSVSYMA